ncbi:MAG: FAD binding domain-containing protein [Acidimicrobiales bacterium]
MGGVTVPESLEELVRQLAERPGSDLLAGGTDLMVEVNFGRHQPSSVVSVTRVPELKGWRREGDTVVLGAALTYTEMMQPPLANLLPALAQAARTVGSPQIRNAGTIGGNLATASPAGDTLPVLLALSASVVVVSDESRRELPLGEFIISPKRTALRPNDLIHSVRVPLAGCGQEFVKVGTRNAMVIAVCSTAVVVDRDRREVRVALGSVGPVPLRALEAEEHAEGLMDWPDGALAATDPQLSEFAQLVAGASRPIDDHRSTARYRSHAVGICARRALVRAAAAGAAGAAAAGGAVAARDTDGAPREKGPS